MISSSGEESTRLAECLNETLDRLCEAIPDHSQKAASSSATVEVSGHAFLLTAAKPAGGSGAIVYGVVEVDYLDEVRGVTRGEKLAYLRSWVEAKLGYLQNSQEVGSRRMDEEFASGIRSSVSKFYFGVSDNSDLPKLLVGLIPEWWTSDARPLVNLPSGGSVLLHGTSQSEIACSVIGLHDAIC